jgi:hypothetical protein
MHCGHGHDPAGPGLAGHEPGCPPAPRRFRLPRDRRSPPRPRPPVTVTPGLTDTTGKISPAFGAAVYTFTDDYDAFGLRLSDGGVRTGLFDGS